MADSPYAGDRAALATMHGKGGIIGPVAHQRLGLAVEVAAVDTDTLGTFSGEIARPAGPVDTAVRKARLGMDATGLPLGLASEGTIADPTGFGLGCLDTEIVVFVDDTRGITVVGRASSWEVTAMAVTVAPGDDLDEVLRRAAVPPHHLVVSPVGATPNSPQMRAAWRQGTTKAVADGNALQAAIARATGHSPQGLARVDTDLRAHLCPSRQPVIAAAAGDLASRLLTPCPSCQTPGWGITDTIIGRQCQWCRGPTDEVAGHRWSCPACDCRDMTLNGDPGDPGRCPTCNP